jgi:uncharacterized membrane protein YdfJ with MMPL/SSD domain
MPYDEADERVNDALRDLRSDLVPAALDGLDAAILLDATLVRLVMLPAALVLLGDRAWWPRGPVAPRGQPVEDPAHELATARQTG